jgi:hypothetical protein
MESHIEGQWVPRQWLEEREAKCRALDLKLIQMTDYRNNAVERLKMAEAMIEKLRKPNDQTILQAPPPQICPLDESGTTEPIGL